jgi:hypothetical protein
MELSFGICGVSSYDFRNVKTNCAKVREWKGFEGREEDFFPAIFQKGFAGCGLGIFR